MSWPGRDKIVSGRSSYMPLPNCKWTGKIIFLGTREGEQDRLRISACSLLIVT